MQKKRVLVLTSTFPRWENDTDPKFIFDLCQNLSKEFDIDILAPHYKRALPYETISGMRVFRFKYFFEKMETLAYSGGIMPNIKKKPWLALLIPFFIASQTRHTLKLINTKDYDLIHAHWLIPQGLSLYILSMFTLRIKQIKIIVTSHGGDIFSLNKFGLEQLKKRVLKIASHITVVSHAMKNKVCSLGIQKSAVSVNPMGVDLKSTFIPSDKKIHRKNIIFVGRLVEVKGVKHLIKAIQKIAVDSPEIHLNIIGDGPLKEELVSLTKKLNIEKNVSFLGSIPNQKIPELLQKSYISVIPSIITKQGNQEGFGLTIVESMGCECIVVASDLPGIRDIINDQHNGFLTNPSDSNSIASTLQYILANPEECRKIAIQGRIDANQKFDWSTVSTAYKKIYKQLIDAN